MGLLFLGVFFEVFFVVPLVLLPLTSRRGFFGVDELRRFFAVQCVAVAALVLAGVPRVPQNVEYHEFADRRSVCCVPNAADVLSNVPFLLVGGIPLLSLSVPEVGAFYSAEERLMWQWFFAGVAIVSVGSAYYHWRPNNDRLVWDRLPMTIGFMSLFAISVEERLGGGMALFWPLLVIGIGSVGYWHVVDDLRPYALVQFLPMLVIPVMMAVCPPRYSHQGHYVGCLLWYALAKVAEVLDRRIFVGSGGVVSGHTLKHLLAAVGIAQVAYMLRARELLVRIE